jgi:phosphoglycolate phosphatase-like HAD superfamily hydrolase
MTAAAPRGLLVDLDGTLADTVYAQVAAWQQALATHDLSIPAWRIHQLLGRGPSALRSELGQTEETLSPDQVNVLRRAHMTAIAPALEHVVPCPGAHDLSGAVRRLHLPSAVVTGGDRNVAETVLQAVAPQTTWAVFVAGVDAAAKPAPDTLELAARHLGVHPRDCWYVGDSVWDMQAATAAGALGIGVLTGGRPGSELSQAGAHEVFDDLRGVAALLLATSSSQLRDAATIEDVR